jgi:hypothetical protein
LCELWGNNLIGPHSTEGSFIAPYYKNFCENVLPPYLEDVSLAARETMWLQQEESRRHFCKAVTEFMNENYEERWIENMDQWLGPLCLPISTHQISFCGIARSPDWITEVKPRRVNGSEIWNSRWYQKRNGTYAVATFSGKTIGSTHAVHFEHVL